MKHFQKTLSIEHIKHFQMSADVIKAFSIFLSRNFLYFL